ncbi:MAG: hypothetical protein KF696_03685 [Planctomycetes bacterium]|nr:hypothetical protein [Planctomycetota bacterium]MCW8134071.1 hypothetical protein [Planctomycetota bacterium]
MARVIHLRCDRCGAPTDGAALWVYCASCGALAAFNFTAYTESPEFLDFQRQAMLDPQGYMRRWEHHNAELERAATLHADSPAAALKIAAEQAEFILSSTPWVFPPASLADPARRTAYREWLGFELLHHRLPGEIRDLYARLNEATAAIGFGANENPLPAFNEMLAVMRDLLQTRQRLGSPPDPDGLSLKGRLRLNAAVMVASYMRLVSPELQSQVLVAIYGEQPQSLPGQDYGVYFDWECPQCGLFSPQAVGTDRMTCPGCYCARDFGPPHEQGAISAVCHGCGARVELAERQMLAQCAYCTSQVQRYVRAGDAHRTLVAEMKAKYAAEYGYNLAEVNAETNGFGVSADNREQRLREGLVRIAQWYHQFLTPARYLGYARASRPADLQALLHETLEYAEREGPPEAAGLVRKAIERAGPAGSASEGN